MGPLKGFKVVEIAGIGPAPVAGMVLADLGADVILVERKDPSANASSVDPTNMGNKAFFKRGKRSIALDLKQSAAIELVLSLVEKTDMLIEGFRPGVMERLGLGPDVCLQRNAALVYGRMTGWGQSGPLAEFAGHDINYLSITGSLHYSGIADDKPYPTPTVMGDVGGGAMHLALGMLAALLDAKRSGIGQVIDAAICDGGIYMMTLLASMRAQGVITDTRGNDFFTAGSHWSNTYICADARYVTVQALEPNFYKELIQLCGFSGDADFSRQHDQALWPVAKEKMALLFRSQPQSHWRELLERSDACFGAVLSLSEAAEHPHNQARNNFIEVDGYLQPAPAPKFSRNVQEVGSPPTLGSDTEAILSELDLSNDTLAGLRAAGIFND